MNKVHIILVSPDRTTALRHFQIARQLLKDLGLPEATEKAQEPQTAVKWLGILIDSATMTLSIPDLKLAQVKEKIRKFASTRSVSPTCGKVYGPSKALCLPPP